MLEGPLESSSSYIGEFMFNHIIPRSIFKITINEMDPTDCGKLLNELINREPEIFQCIIKNLTSLLSLYFYHKKELDTRLTEKALKALNDYNIERLDDLIHNFGAQFLLIQFLISMPGNMWLDRIRKRDKRELEGTVDVPLDRTDICGEKIYADPNDDINKLDKALERVRSGEKDTINELAGLIIRFHSKKLSIASHSPLQCVDTRKNDETRSKSNRGNLDIEVPTDCFSNYPDGTMHKAFEEAESILGEEQFDWFVSKLTEQAKGLGSKETHIRINLKGTDCKPYTKRLRKIFPPPTPEKAIEISPHEVAERICNKRPLDLPPNHPLVQRMYQHYKGLIPKNDASMGIEMYNNLQERRIKEMELLDLGEPAEPLGEPALEQEELHRVEDESAALKAEEAEEAEVPKADEAEVPKVGEPAIPQGEPALEPGELHRVEDEAAALNAKKAINPQNASPKPQNASAFLDSLERPVIKIITAPVPG